MRATLLTALTASVLLCGPIAAQNTPAEWKWVTDSPGEPGSAWEFVNMAPGWHVTMGPGGILYHPGTHADARFVVQAEIFLFPNSSDEGYGVFIGGRDLESSARSYIAFIARADGSAGLFREHDGRLDPIVDWTSNPAILTRAGDAVKNVLRLEAENDSVRLLVNDAQIASLPRADLPLDGIVGLRIGSGINVHTTNLDVTRRLAPK